MDQDTREIETITFGVYSAEEIKKMAVCKIDNSKLCNNDKNPDSMLGTVYDPRMGTIENGSKCPTCQNSVWECPGHFGYTELNEPIIHPLFYKNVVSFLKCFCTKCFKLLITQDQINLNKLNKIKGNSRFNKILERLEKIDMCTHCSQPQPDIKYTASDNTISLVYKQKDKGKVSIIYPVDEIKKAFDNVSNNDVELLGFDPTLIHPKNLILTVFPIIPPCCRPYIVTEGNICDDDLTHQLVEIIKANNHLAQIEGGPMSETKKQKHLQSLKFRISTFYNNSQGRAKHTGNSRPIKGLKERLSSKDGLIRANLMGKRVDGSGRTVIGPDPTLKMGQLAFPQEMADNLTIPVQVTNYNYDFLTNIVNSGKANYVLKNGETRINLENALFFKGTRLMHGDIIIRKDKDTDIEHEIIVNNGKELLKKGDKIKRNGVLVKDLKYPEKRNYTLSIGDIVERKLMDGDIVLLNRQPTLHAGSMLAQEILVRPGRTLRFNLSIAKSFNADESSS
jgi:DNA-directed RNA polymerase beta' subunit